MSRTLLVWKTWSTSVIIAGVLHVSDAEVYVGLVLGLSESCSCCKGFGVR